MYQFFSESYEAVRLRMLKDRVSSAQSEYDSAEEKRREAAEQLNQAQNELSTMENHYLNIKIAKQQIEQELREIDAERNHLNIQYHQYINELEKANQFKDECEDKIKLLDSDKQKLKSSMEALRSQIRSYDSIIAEPEPEPQYKLDGEYCINGIHLCKNHPPRQVLVNEEEIEQHRQAIAEAIRERGELYRQLQELEKQYRDLEQIEFSLQENYQAAIEYFELCQQTVDNLQQEITQADSLYNQKSLELENDNEEENRLKIEGENMRGRLYDLQNELSRQETEVHYAQNILTNAISEYENAAEAYEASRATNQQNSPFLDDENQKTRESLMSKFGKLAIEELKNEGLDLGNFFKERADHFFGNTNSEKINDNEVNNLEHLIDETGEQASNMGIRALQRVGEVVGGMRSPLSQIKENYKDLKKFVNESLFPTLGKTSEEIDKFFAPRIHNN